MLYDILARDLRKRNAMERARLGAARPSHTIDINTRGHGKRPWTVLIDGMWLKSRRGSHGTIRTFASKEAAQKAAEEYTKPRPELE